MSEYLGIANDHHEMDDKHLDSCLLQVTTGCLRDLRIGSPVGVGDGVSFSLLLRNPAFSCHKDADTNDLTVSKLELNWTLFAGQYF
jgi:hypothetical protein